MSASTQTGDHEQCTVHAARDFTLGSVSGVEPAENMTHVCDDVSYDD